MRPDLVEIVAHLRASGTFRCSTRTAGTSTREARARCGTRGSRRSASRSTTPTPRGTTAGARSPAHSSAPGARSALLRDAAPHGGKQVHVMTVLMDDNADDLDAAARAMSRAERRRPLRDAAVDARVPPRARRVDCRAAHDAGAHRRAAGRSTRTSACSATTSTASRRSSPARPMPACRAGVQSFNVDHVGNVSPCIEKIDRAVRQRARASRCASIHRRMREADAGARLPGVLDGLPRLQSGARRRRQLARVARSGDADAIDLMRYYLIDKVTELEPGERAAASSASR